MDECDVRFGPFPEDTTCELRRSSTGHLLISLNVPAACVFQYSMPPWLDTSDTYWALTNRSTYQIG